MPVQDREKKLTRTKTLSWQFSVVQLWIMFVNVYHYAVKRANSFAIKINSVGHQIGHN